VVDDAGRGDVVACAAAAGTRGATSLDFAAFRELLRLLDLDAAPTPPPLCGGDGGALTASQSGGGFGFGGSGADQFSLVRGAFVLVGMSAWGAQRMSALAELFPYTTALGSPRSVSRCRDSLVLHVVLLSLQRLAKKYGASLRSTE